MLTFSIKIPWMAIYSIVGPNICQVSVHPEIALSLRKLIEDPNCICDMCKINDHL